MQDFHNSDKHVTVRPLMSYEQTCISRIPLHIRPTDRPTDRPLAFFPLLSFAFLPFGSSFVRSFANRSFVRSFARSLAYSKCPQISRSECRSLPRISSSISFVRSLLFVRSFIHSTTNTNEQRTNERTNSPTSPNKQSTTDRPPLCALSECTE